jgi:ADP-heptose:LPS heptosyltransferase
MIRAADKILVIKLGAFGDLVQVDGVLRDIRAFHADAEIVLLTTPPFQKLMQRCPHVDRVLAASRAPFWKLGEWLRLASMFKSERFTKVYDLQKQSRTRLYRKLFFRNVRWSGEREKQRLPSGLSGFVSQLEREGIQVIHTSNPDVGWMVDDIGNYLAQEGVRKPYVVLIPGCSARHPQKRWPYYAELAAALIERGYEVVTAPGPEEIDLAKGIPGHTLRGPNGYMNWFELAGVLKESCFVVGNDTGPSHVASCLGKPGLALFGPHTTEARSVICRGDFNAIEVPSLDKLSVEAVLEAVLPNLPVLQEKSV